MPERIQRQRTKGWRMPSGAFYVGRPTVFGNPWTREDARSWRVPDDWWRKWVVGRYRAEVAAGIWPDWPVDFDTQGADTFLEYVRITLAGRDLVCWCPLDQPCHADVLLELANGGA